MPRETVKYLTSLPSSEAQPPVNVRPELTGSIPFPRALPKGKQMDPSLENEALVLKIQGEVANISYNQVELIRLLDRRGNTARLHWLFFNDSLIQYLLF